MREVAALAGVSGKTVSRVMRNDRYVSEEVRGRVERAIAELRYVPNVLARTFRSGSDNAIGVAVPDISDPFFAAAIHAVEAIARARGSAVIVTSLGDDGAHERAGVEALLGRQLAGLVSTPVSRDQSYLEPWLSRMAVVFIDRPPTGIKADSVIADDVGGARNATAHLVRHGHRRIAFIGDTLEIATVARRLKGYQKAIAEAGLSYDPQLVALEATQKNTARELTLKLLAAPDPPTAIFSSTVRCSIGVVPALQSADRTDVPLISFGDFPLAMSLRPAPTVVDHDPGRIGRVAATRLFERLDHPRRRLKRHVVLPVDLVLQAACCGPPAATGTELAAT
ncbi:MAG TPA: LacI family DNA-binding transcriptional regulator [Pseudonocardia sp.]